MKIQIRWWCAFLLLVAFAAPSILGQTTNPLLTDDNTTTVDDDLGNTTTIHDDTFANGISSSPGEADAAIINNQYWSIRKLLTSTLGRETFTNVNQDQNIEQRYEQRNTGAILISKPKCMGTGGLAPKWIAVCGIVQGENKCDQFGFGLGPDGNMRRVRQLLQKYAS